LGAWGTGLFQDDKACDIRHDYKDHLGNGLSGPEATALILVEYKSSLADFTRPEWSGLPWPQHSGVMLQKRVPPISAILSKQMGEFLKRWFLMD